MDFVLLLSQLFSCIYSELYSTLDLSGVFCPAYNFTFLKTVIVPCLCRVFLCPNNGTAAGAWGSKCAMLTDVSPSNCTQEQHKCCKRVYTESWLGKKNPSPHQEVSLRDWTNWDFVFYAKRKTLSHHHQAKERVKKVYHGFELLPLSPIRRFRWGC